MFNELDFYNNYEGKKVRYETYLKKLAKGMSPENAIIKSNTYPEKRLSSHTRYYREYSGEKCNYHCFLSRVQRGLTYEEAINPEKMMAKPTKEHVNKVREAFKKFDKYHEVRVNHYVLDRCRKGQQY